MNILYCGDKKVLDGLIISVLSLAKHTKEPLNIFVLTMYLKGYEPIPYESIEELDKILKKKNPKHSIKLIDITEIFYTEMPKANLSTFFTPYCLLRLYADLVPELPSKLLYLDIDVVALKDPSQLYRIKNDDYDKNDKYEIKTNTEKDVNNHNEGYYYVPHYEIPIKTFSTINSVMPMFLNIRSF